MTKFGTPTGAGPGRPSVSVGLSRVGAPSGVRMSPGFVLLALLALRLAGSSSSRNSPGRVLLSVCALSRRLSSPPSVVGRRSSAGGGPPSSTFLIGALISGSWICVGRRAGRDVDGGHDLLAADERDRDRAQLGERRETTQRRSRPRTGPPSARRRGSSVSSLVNLASCCGHSLAPLLRRRDPTARERHATDCIRGLQR